MRNLVAGMAVAAMLAITPAHAGTRIYVVRGLVGWLLAPMNDIAAELRRCGAVVVMTSWTDGGAIAADACAHKADRIVLVAHSLGVPTAAGVIAQAKACGVRDISMVGVDPPANGASVRAARALNFVGTLGGTIAGARNIPTPGYGHIAIVNDRAMQARIVAAAMAR